jgi:CRISPR/Cas system-associated exonuclease Cas4 (RecB family)
MSQDERQGKPSASGFERIVLCPGSWKMERNLPEERSDDADSGTRIHNALEMEDSAGLSDEELEMFEQCKSQCKRSIDSILNDLNHIRIVSRETRLWFHDKVSAKVDVIGLQGNQALILDYKTGRGEVTNPVGNYQLMVAAVCARWEYSVDYVTTGIIQPHASREPLLANYDKTALDDAEEVIEQALHEVSLANAPLVPGEKQCKYCKAAAICPALRREVEVLSMTTTTQAPGEVISPTDIASILDRIGAAKKAIASIESTAKKMLEEGVEIPGWELSPGSKRREVVNVSGLLDQCVGIGVKESDFIAKVDIGIGDVEKILKQASGKKGKEFDSFSKTFLSPFVIEKQSAKSLQRKETNGISV